MDPKKRSHYFLLFGLVAAFLIAYFLVQPFLSPLILAAVFAFLFQPLYTRILRLVSERHSLASFVTLFVAIVLIMLPIVFIGVQIFKESRELYEVLAGEGEGNFLLTIEGVADQLRGLLPASLQDFKVDFTQYVRQGLDAILHNIGTIFSSFASIVLSFFVFLISFYYLLKDGGKLKDHFVSLSPLDDADDEMIVSRLSSSVSSVVKGNLTIGLIQGLLTGIGFALFGVPNAVLWGCVTAIAALIPGIGTALVIAPAIIFLFVTGNNFGGIGLLIWGVLAVGMIDNFLGPKLMGHGMRMHPLIVFLAVLGGLAFFGPLGFLLGPLAMSLCLALIEIYFSLKAREKEAQM